MNNNNTELITKFYTAFQQLDYKTMQDCYTEDAIFNDPIFGLLTDGKVKYMWQMLCTNAKDFSLQFSDIKLLDEEYTTCQWTAHYTFSKTGRPVVNDIKAYVRIENGKITEHTDHFKIWKWSRQALGLPGLLFGWSHYMKNKISGNARKNLDKFIEAQAA
jgi:ketosteroid isomerase-like protein